MMSPTNTDVRMEEAYDRWILQDRPFRSLPFEHLLTYEAASLLTARIRQAFVAGYRAAADQVSLIPASSREAD